MTFCPMLLLLCQIVTLASARMRVSIFACICISGCETLVVTLPKKKVVLSTPKTEKEKTKPEERNWDL